MKVLWMTLKLSLVEGESQIPVSVFRKRCEEQLVHIASDRITHLIDIFYSKFVGQIVEVLFDTVSKKDKTKISGYERHGRLVHVDGDESLIGQIKKVKITSSRTYSLMGEIIDD